MRTKSLVLLFAFYIFVFLSGSLLSVNLTVLSLFTAVGYFLIIVRNGMGIGHVTKGQVLVYVFLLYGLLTVFWSDAPVYGTRKLFLVLIFIFIMGLFKEHVVNSVPIFLKYFSSIFLVFLVFFFAQHGLEVFNISSIYSRFNLTGDQNPIVVAYFFSFAIITLVAYTLLKSRNPVEYAGLAVGILFSLALAVLTGSKGPLVGLLVCFLLVMIFKRQISLKVILTLSLVFGFAYLAVMYATKNFDLNPVIIDFIQARFFGDNESSQSFSSRTIIFQLAIHEYLESSPLAMIFGNGSGSFGYFYTGRDEMMYPHNLFLEILFEYGLVGVTIFLAMVLRVVYLNIFSNFDKSRKYLFYVFYFALIVSQISRDITGNCLIFVFYIFIEDSQATKFLLRKKGKYEAT